MPPSRPAARRPAKVTETAYLAHRMPGRARLRLPDRRGDAGFFAELAERLAECEGIARIEANPRTGSVLITHAGDLEAILGFGERQGLFALFSREPREPSMAKRLHAEFQGVSEGLSRATGGQLDLAMAVFVLLVSGAFVQLLRGNVFGPTTTLLWYASSLLAARAGTSDGAASDAPE